MQGATGVRFKEVAADPGCPCRWGAARFPAGTARCDGEGGDDRGARAGSESDGAWASALTRGTVSLGRAERRRANRAGDAGLLGRPKRKEERAMRVQGAGRLGCLGWIRFLVFFPLFLFQIHSN